MQKLAIGWRASAEELERLREALPSDLELTAPAARQTGSGVYECSDAELSELLAGAGILLAWNPLRPEVLQRAQDLRLIVFMRPGIGLPAEKKAGDGSRVITVVINEDFGSTIAEYAFAFMLGLARRLRQNHEWVQTGAWRGYWNPATTATKELRGASVCIVGTGSASQALASFCQAFGMKVDVIDEAPSSDRGGVGASKLQAGFGAADFIVITGPLTAHSGTIVNAESISWMSHSGYVVNMGDAELVEEGPLFAALKKGNLAGYASQTWWDYPNTLSPGYHFPVASRRGLQHLDNVLTSGEVALNALSVRNRILDAAAAAVRAHAEGEGRGVAKPSRSRAS